MSDFITGNVLAACHPKIRELCDYWRSIHPPDHLPGRQHFDPCDVAPLLPDIYLLDVCPQTADLTFRLMGTGLVTLFGHDYTGLPFEQAYTSGKGSYSYRDITDMLETKQPRWRQARAMFAAGRDYLTLERVILPLAKDGTTVDIVLGMVVTVRVDSSTTGF